MANKEPKKGPGMKPITNITQLSGLGAGAVTETDNKPDYKAAIRALQNSEKTDHSTWRVIGEGVFGANGEDSTSLMASMLSQGDRDKTYDMLSGLNPTDPGAAAARQAYMQHVDYEREQEEAERLRKEQEALARARQTASGGNAQTVGTVSSANTSTYDAEIARLKKMLAQESRLGRQDQIGFLNSELARVQQERAQAAANRAGNPDDFIASIPERTKAAARQQNRSRSPEALQETPSLADLQEQLYAAQGANDQSEIDRLQREIARVGETQQSVELRAEVDAFRSNPYSGMDDATLGQTIDEIRSRISLAQSMQQRALADTSRQMTPDERYASAQPWRDEEARQNANLQAALSAYQMGEEQRSRMQVLSDAQGELDRAKDAVSRAGNVYNQAVSEYNASVSAMREADENVRIANAEGQYYADMYKARANQLNALVRQYEARAASGADAEDLTALYEKIRQAEVDVNLLENAVGQKGTAQQLAINAYNQSVGAYNQAIEGVQGASGAVDYVQQRLENRIGTYYDAVAESRSLPTAYKDAYENVLGLTALIDGYEQRIEQTRDARDVAEYSSRIGELKAERAQYYAYAYEYEMSRTLAGMSEQELSDFRTIAEYLRNPDIYDARSDLSTKAREYERKYKEQYGDINYNRVLDMVSREEDRRHRESYQKMIEGESWLGDVGLSAISVITNMLSVPGALAEIVVQSVDDVDAPINTNARGFLMQNVTRDIRGVIGQKIEQSILDAGGSAQDAHLASMGYSTLLSGLDSAVAVFTGRAGASALGLGAEAAEKIGGALLGATAASTSMQDIVERGGKPEEALIGGLIAGTFECLFEKWSIGNFTALEESVGVGDFYEVLTNLAKSALTNFEEEAATELANIAYDGLSGFLGGQSEWKNRFYELKSANHLTDAQTALALASEIAVQIVEAGASGALMGAGFGAIGSITGNIRNRQNNRALQSVYDEQINSGYERLMEMNSMLLPENRIDLPTLDEHTTFEQLQEVAQQVKDAVVKQNATVKTVEAENPEAVAAARARASELSAVNVHTVATAADVSAQAEAGAQAGEADARTAENAVSRETSADTAQTETVAPAEEESDLAEEDALKEIAELDESAGGKSYYMDEAADRIAQLREEGRGEVADAMQRILDARENGTAEEAPAQAEVTNGAESGIINAEGGRSRTNVFTADEQAEIVRLADTVISGAMDAADARVYAQEIANDYRAAARPDIAEAIVAEVESRLAGGNENAALYDNGRERTASANPGRQSGRVAERAGEAAGTAERAESGGRAGAEQGRTGEAGGSGEVTDSAVRDMSELDKNGYPGKTVRDVTDSPEHISLRERAKADGVDLVIVEGPLHFKTKTGKDFPTNGAYDPATNKIYVQADFSGYSTEEIYNHELFHMRKAQNSAMYAEVEKLVRSLYKNDLAAVLNQYRGLYSKLGDVSDDYLLEELCADCYAGMDRFERDQSYYADDMQKIVDKYEYSERNHFTEENMWQKRDGENGWGATVDDTTSALVEAVMNRSEGLYDILQDEGQEGRTDTPVLNAIIGIANDVRQETVTPAAAIEYIVRTFNESGEKGVAGLVNPRTGNALSQTIEAMKTIDSEHAATEDSMAAGSKFSAASDLDAKYMDALERVEENGVIDRESEWQLQTYVNRAAVEWGAVTDENASGHIKKPLDLYHGTKTFGFTKWDDSNTSHDTKGLIYTSTKREVAANYAGRDHYAGTRPIGRPYIENATSTKDIIQNAQTIYESKYHVMTQEERAERRANIEAEAKPLVDAIDSLYDVSRLNDFLQWDDEFLTVTNAVDRLFSIVWTVSGNTSEGYTNEEYREYLKTDIDNFERSLQIVRDYIDEHYDELKAMDGAKDLLKFLNGSGLFDFYVDVSYSLYKILGEEELITNMAGGSINTPEDLQRGMDEVHNIGAYHLYGNLGENPLIIDAEGRQWTFVKAPEVMGDDEWHSTDAIARKAKETGYTSVVVKNVYDGGGKADDYIFFNADQVKSADPITYDDDGNIIPLSERFDTTTPERRNDLRYSAASTDDLLNDAASGYESEDGKAPTMEKKAASASAASELDRRAKEAYDKALAEHNEALADLLHKQWAAQDKSRDLYREANMEMNAYRADGNREHLNRANDLRRQAKLEQQKASRLSKQTNLDLDQHFEPKKAMRQAADRIMQTFKVKPGLKAQYRAEIADMLADIYRRGSINDADVERLVYRLADDSTAYFIPDAAHEQIREIMKGARIYVSPEVRAEFGDRSAYDDFRRYCWGMGINLTSNESDRAIDSYYDELSSTIGEGLFPEETDMAAMLHRMADEMALAVPRETSFLSELTKEEGANVDEVYEDLINNVLDTLTAFAEDANLETRLSVKPDTDTMRMKARYEAREDLLRERRDALVKKIKDHAKEVNERGRERRKRSDRIKHIRSELDRIYKRAKVNNQNYTRVINDQNEATREHMEDVYASLQGMAAAMTGAEITNPAQLAGWIKQYRADNPGFDPSNMLDTAADALSQISDWKQMSVEDLNLLLDVLRGIDHMLANANRIISESLDSRLDETGAQMRRETRALQRGPKRLQNLYYSEGMQKVRNLFNEESLNYSRNLKRYGGWNPNSVMYKMALEFEQADMKYMNYKLGADMVMWEYLRRTNNSHRDWLKTAAGEKAKLTTIELPLVQAWGEGDAPIWGEDGPNTVKVQVNQMQLVQMYLDLKNEDNLRHVLRGGYTFPEAELYNKSKSKKTAYAEGHGVTVKMTQAQIQNVVDQYLAADGKAFGDLLDRYYNVYAKPYINQTSRALDGIDKAINDHYSPIRNNRNYISSEYNIHNGVLENMGPLQHRVVGAGNPIYLADADETFEWHKEMMAKYYGYAIPLRDMKAIMNYAPKTGSDSRTKNVAVLDGAFTNADSFMTDFFTVVEGNRLEKARTLKGLLGAYVSNALTANISSMLKQFAALPLAGTSIGNEPIVYAAAHFWESRDNNLIRKYTAYLDERANGLVYDQITDIVRENAGSAWQMSKATLLGRNWLEATDYAANKLLWIAAEHYVDTHTNLRPGTQADIQSGKDPYYKKVAEVFNRMTFDTQTNSNMMARPNILQRADSALKAFTLFKTDAFQIQGILRESVGQMRWANANGTAAEKREAKQKLYHSIQGVVLSSMVQSALGMFAKFLRRRDDEWKNEDGSVDVLKLIKRFGVDTLENIVGCVLFGSSVFGLINSWIDKDTKWYGLEDSVLAMVNNLVSAVNGFSKIAEAIEAAKLSGDMKGYLSTHIDDIGKPIRAIAQQIAPFLGVSLSNMEKNILAIFGWVWPDASAAVSSLWTATTKNSLTGKTGAELKAGVRQYLNQQIGQLDESVVAEYTRLHEVFGDKALPGFGVPEMKDENGKARKLTSEENAKWETAYRTAMIDAVNSMIGSEAYEGLTDDEKVNVLAQAADYARLSGKDALGLSTSKAYGYVRDAVDYGADLGNALIWYKLKGDKKQAEKFADLERLNISDEQKAAILRGMYPLISGGKEWASAADSKSSMEFLSFARDKLTESELTPASSSAQSVTPAPLAAEVTPAEPVQEQPKEDPLKPEYDKAMSAGISEDGAQAAVKAVKGLGSDASAYEKRNAAVMALDSVEDQLAACKYYSEKPEADYGRYSAANGFGVTPKAFFTFYNDAVARYGQLSQNEAQAALDGRDDLTQEQKAAMWQLCGANWSASKNPYAVYISEQVRDAYYAAG